MRLIKKKLILPALAIATLLASSLTVQASTNLPKPTVKIIDSSVMIKADYLSKKNEVGYQFSKKNEKTGEYQSFSGRHTQKGVEKEKVFFADIGQNGDYAVQLVVNEKESSPRYFTIDNANPNNKFKINYSDNKQNAKMKIRQSYEDKYKGKIAIFRDRDSKASRKSTIKLYSVEKDNSLKLRYTNKKDAWHNESRDWVVLFKPLKDRYAYAVTYTLPNGKESNYMMLYYDKGRNQIWGKHATVMGAR